MHRTEKQHLARRLALLALPAACVGMMALSSSAWADSYPSKPIRLIVPFAPGGVTDTGARVVAEKLSERLGQQVVVDNKPGASGNIGTQLAATAAPDGYTLVVGFDGTMVVNPHVYKKVPFDTLKDFAPISKIGDAALIIVTHPSVPVKDLQSLIAYSKSTPGGVSYGSAGTGSTPHLAGELLKVKTGANFEHVPYKGGGQAMADVVGGTLPMLYTAVAGAYQFVQRGQVKAIAVSTAKRLPSLPNVPTVAESGVPGFVVNSWIGILAPAKTPQPIIDRLQKELNAVVHSPETKERLASLGIESSGNTPAEFRAEIETDLKKYADVVKTANIRVD